MKLGIRAKLFAVSLVVIAASVLAAYAYLHPALARTVTERTRAELGHRARLVATHAAKLDPANEQAWDALADELGSRSGARVTLVRGDGRVLGDSELSRDELRALENHSDRPEIAAAMRGGESADQRDSATLGARLLYVATSFETKRGRAVARVALPMKELDDAVRTLQKVLGVAFLLGLAVAIVMSTLAAELTTRSARALTSAARRMASGELDARTGISGKDELGQLGVVLDRLAESLSETLGALARERDHGAAILDGMREGVALLDADSHVVRVNPALCSMLGVAPDVVGQPVDEAFQNARLARVFQEAEDTGEAVEDEIEFDAAPPRRLLVRITRLEAPEARLAVFVDMTEQRRLEALRKDFVDNVSHELRTPVAAILSAAETLCSAARSDPDAAPKFVAMIERNAERLRALLEDLLNLSRIESRQFQIDIAPTDVRGIIDRVVASAATGAPPGAKLTAAGLGSALADARSLEHVLTNLVDNALKYGGPDVNVEVGVRQGEDVVVWVADDGPGIPADHLPRIFERFYRVDQGRSRAVGGTGLGLAIVKHLVAAMGGTTSVESRTGNGTRFSVTLPAAPSLPTPAPRR